MNTTRTSAPLRQPAYHDQARSYEHDTAAFQPYRRAVVEALPLDSGQVVLDVGCGTGLCCGLLRDKVGPRGGVVGIEESPEMAADKCSDTQDLAVPGTPRSNNARSVVSVATAISMILRSPIYLGETTKPFSSLPPSR